MARYQTYFVFICFFGIFVVVVVFHHKICGFTILIALFDEVIKFPQHNINQSGAEIGGPDFPVYK